MKNQIYNICHVIQIVFSPFLVCFYVLSLFCQSNSEEKIIKQNFGDKKIVNDFLYWPMKLENEIKLFGKCKIECIYDCYDSMDLPGWYPKRFII